MESTAIRFFDAFSELDLESRLYHIFSDMDVKKVTTSGVGKTVKIYLVSRSIISRRDIERVERALAEQIFRETLFHPIVFVTFDMGTDCSTEEIFDRYREVWIEEIRERRPIDFFTFCRETASFADESTVELVCEDEPVAHNRSTNMKKYIET